jgi:hypothetical protein
MPFLLFAVFGLQSQRRERDCRWEQEKQRTCETWKATQISDRQSHQRLISSAKTKTRWTWNSGKMLNTMLKTRCDKIFVISFKVIWNHQARLTSRSKIFFLFGQAKTPPEFIEKAKMIVCNHHELQRSKASLESEIAKLEQTQGQMVAKKERELIDNAMRVSGLSLIEAKAVARRKVDSVVNGHKPSTKEQV